MYVKNVLKKLNLISLVFSGGILLMLILSSFMYNLWIGDRVTIPFLLSITMALYAIISVVLAPYTHLINGFGKLKLTTVVIIFQVIVFIPLAIVLTKSRLGVAGVMFTTILVNGIALILEPIQTYRILNKRAVGIWNK